MSGYVIRNRARSIYQDGGRHPRPMRDHGYTYFVKRVTLPVFGETWEVGGRDRAHVFPTQRAALAELRRRGDGRSIVLSVATADRDEAMYEAPDYYVVPRATQIGGAL